jgi:hypothetical protein
MEDQRSYYLKISLADDVQILMAIFLPIEEI